MVQSTESEVDALDTTTNTVYHLSVPHPNKLHDENCISLFYIFIYCVPVFSTTNGLHAKIKRI